MLGPGSSLFIVALDVATLVSAAGAAAQSAAPQAPSALVPSYPPMVELVKALAWPLIAVVVALLFRKPLGEFVGALGTRVTKLSVFKVELELVPAATAVVSPLLDDIRTVTTSAAISDSSRAMLEQLQNQTPADFDEINLGAGDEWLTSRLYIAAVMLERMRGVQVLVFLERTPATDRRFVAVVPVKQLRWALAQRYPWLEAAFVRAYIASFPPPLCRRLLGRPASESGRLCHGDGTQARGARRRRAFMLAILPVAGAGGR